MSRGKDVVELLVMEYCPVRKIMVCLFDGKNWKSEMVVGDREQEQGYR